jgi:uncharacterized protein (TIGR02117 family)
MPFRRLVLHPLVLLLFLTACATPVSVPVTGDAAIYVVKRNWHTDIGLPVQEISGPLRVMEQAYPGVQYLTFGFGERNYLVTRDRSIGTMLSALLPSQSAVLMTALRAPPDEAFGAENVIVLHLPADALARLEVRIWQGFEHAGNAVPEPLAQGPYLGSTFYAGTDTYSGVFNCNTWTAEMLRSAGLVTTSSGILFSSQMMQLARGIAARQGASHGHAGPPS